MDVFLCYLSLTDKHFYEIKNIDKKNKMSIIKIFKCIKYKIICFFVFTFVLLVFYWYFVSAFCAVYQNTQKTFIKDSASSFINNLIYPFALYLMPSALRIIALKHNGKNKLKCVYKMSNLIPFF